MAERKLKVRKSRPRWAEERASALRVGAARELAIWPLASTEHHGPHLPTGTDAMINEALQAGLPRSSPARAVLRVLPTLTIGASEHHIPFGGTLSLPPVQYAGLLTQGIHCLLAQGHRRVLLLNSHGEPTAATGEWGRELLQYAVRTVREAIENWLRSSSRW